MVGNNKAIDSMKLEGGEPALVAALRAGKQCLFRHEGKSAQPKSERTIRGHILGKILRSEKLNSEDDIIPLPRAVNIYGALIEGELDMSDTDTGLVLRINHSRFDTEVDFTRAKLALLGFEHSDLVGAEMDFIVTTSHLWLVDVKNDGNLSIRSANIGGQLAIGSSKRQTHLKNPNKSAIDIEGTQIKQDFFLCGTLVEGIVDLSGARIDGQFDASSESPLMKNEKFQTIFDNPDHYAISAHSCTIAGGVFLTNAIVKGEVDFRGAEIGWQFCIHGASFVNTTDLALCMQGTIVKDLLTLHDMPHAIIGSLDLIDAELSSIMIDEHSFPLGQFRLDGTHYKKLYGPNGQPHTTCEGWITRAKASNNRWDSHTRLWESIKTAFPEKSAQEVKTIFVNSLTQTRSPFAYRQFAKVLDANGHEREARGIRVIAAKAFTDRTVEALYPGWEGTPAKILRWCLRKLYRFWRYVLGKTTGYGEHLQYAAYWLLALLIVGTLYFWCFTPDMVPAKERFYMTKEAYDAWTASGTLPEGYPKFNPFLYALDVMLPIVDVGQESHWRPKNVTRLWNGPRIYNHLHLAIGWFLSTIGIAGLTGLLKDKRE